MRNDIIEIEQVLYRCCHAIDKGEIDTFVNLFHPDASFMITWEENGKYEGHKEIQEWAVNYDKIIRSSMKYLRHKITCPIINVSEDDATATSYLDAESVLKDTSQVTITVGRYEDKLAKSEGFWRLKEKVVFMDNMYTI
jgi:3-phenylpropionate/cinnamic acid dioxygenase small subunit